MFATVAIMILYVVDSSDFQQPVENDGEHISLID